MTDNAERTARLAAFYRERLVPVAKAARARGHEWIEAGRDPSAETYYIPCASKTTHVFALPAGEAGAALAALWSAKDARELADMAASIVELAKALHVPGDEPGDVSEFIYAMF